MSKTSRLIFVMAVAALALPAVAGSWPPIAPRWPSKAAPVATTPIAAAAAAIDGFAPSAGEAGWRLVQPHYDFVNGSLVRAKVPAMLAAVTPARTSRDGFEATGGESGWQLSQHKYRFAKGKPVMSDECGHAVRSAQAPTPAEIESARRLSPGA